MVALTELCELQLGCDVVQVYFEPAGIQFGPDSKNFLHSFNSLKV